MWNRLLAVVLLVVFVSLAAIACGYVPADSQGVPPTDQLQPQDSVERISEIPVAIFRILTVLILILLLFFGFNIITHAPAWFFEQGFFCMQGVELLVGVAGLLSLCLLAAIFWVVVLRRG